MSIISKKKEVSLEFTTILVNIKIAYKAKFSMVLFLFESLNYLLRKRNKNRLHADDQALLVKHVIERNAMKIP